MSPDLEPNQYIGRILNDRYLLAAPFAVAPLNWMFRALDVALNREVAVKLLKSHTLEDVDFLGRFKYHAQRAAQLNHQNIASIYDWGLDESPYLVTELCKGGNLRELPQLNLEQVISIGVQAAAGLAHAHQEGIVHKNLSFNNILFDAEGRLKLTDFAIAPMFMKKSPPGVTESLLGASYYSAPEQLTGDVHLTDKVDIYALALILIEAATGKPPLPDDTNMGSYITRMSESLAVPESLEELGEVLSLALKLDPGQRPSATELVWYLESLPSYRPVVALPPRHEEPTSPTEIAREITGEIDWEKLKAGRKAKKPKARNFKVQKTKAKANRLPKLSGVAAVAMAIVLVLGAAGFGAAGFWSWFKDSDHPKVPDVVSSLDLAELEKNWEVQRFELRTEDVPAGNIISLDPPPGTSLKNGSVLRVTFSKGDPLIRLPANLLGGTLEETIPRLSGLGLKLGQVFLREDAFLQGGAAKTPLVVSEESTSDYLVVGFEESTSELPRGSEVSLLVSRSSDR